MMKSDVFRIKQSNRFLFVLLLLLPSLAAAASNANPNLNATLWLQASAEYKALTTQTYALAKMQLKAALEDKSWTAALEQSGNVRDLKPAVILDIDETVLDNSPYQAELIRKNRHYCSDSWDRWIEKTEAAPIPGAKAFVQYAQRLGVEVIYITNRTCRERDNPDQRCPQKQDTINNLRRLGFPATSETVMLRKEKRGWGSEKRSRREEIVKNYRVLMMIGDDLGDFIPGVKKNVSPEQRTEKMADHSSWWGNRWHILPNPMYGSWLRALGEESQDHLQGYSTTDPVTAMAKPTKSKRSKSKKSKLRLATWNIANLHWELNKHLPGRPRAAARSPQDFERLKHYAKELKADIIALQEVNGPKAVHRVFPQKEYHVLMSDRYEEDMKTGRQTDHIYTALVIRKDAPVKIISTRTVDALSVDHTDRGKSRPTRRAVEAVLELPSGKALYVLSVHLKSGCHQGKLEQATSAACKTLAKQIKPLEQWIDDLASKNEAFVVLGDFNRRFDVHGKSDHLWQDINDGDPKSLSLFRLPYKTKSTCLTGTKGYKPDPIDFIVADTNAWRMFEHSSIQMMDYSKEDKAEYKKISDHCPTYVDLSHFE